MDIITQLALNGFKVEIRSGGQISGNRLIMALITAHGGREVLEARAPNMLELEQVIQLKIAKIGLRSLDQS